MSASSFPSFFFWLLFSSFSLVNLPPSTSSTSSSPAAPPRRLQTMVEQILSKVPGISRVCYDLTSKPPATTEWE